MQKKNLQKSAKKMKKNQKTFFDFWDVEVEDDVDDEDLYCGHFNAFLHCIQEFVCLPVCHLLIMLFGT